MLVPLEVEFSLEPVESIPGARDTVIGPRPGARTATVTVVDTERCEVWTEEMRVHTSQATLTSLGSAQREHLARVRDELNRILDGDR